MISVMEAHQSCKRAPSPLINCGPTRQLIRAFSHYKKKKKPKKPPKVAWSEETGSPLAAAVWSRYPPTPLRWDGVAGSLSLPGVPPFARYPLEPPETQRLPVGCGLLPESGVPVPGDGRLATSKVCELGLRKREPSDPFTQIRGCFDSILLT